MSMIDRDRTRVLMESLAALREASASPSSPDYEAAWQALYRLVKEAIRAGKMVEFKAVPPMQDIYPQGRARVWLIDRDDLGRAFYSDNRYEVPSVLITFEMMESVVVLNTEPKEGGTNA